MALTGKHALLILLILVGFSSYQVAKADECNLMGLMAKDGDGLFRLIYEDAVDILRNEATTEGDYDGWGMIRYKADGSLDSQIVHSYYDVFDGTEGIPVLYSSQNGGIRAAIAHSRNATTGNYDYDPHPFEFRWMDEVWAIAHNGSLGESDEDWWGVMRALIGDASWDFFVNGYNENYYNGIDFHPGMYMEENEAVDSKLLAIYLMKMIRKTYVHKQVDGIGQGIRLAYYNMVEEFTSNLITWSSLNILFIADDRKIYGVVKTEEDYDEEHRLWTNHSLYNANPEGWVIVSADEPPDAEHLNIWDNDGHFTEISNNNYVILAYGSGMTGELSLNWTGWEEMDGRYAELYNTIQMDQVISDQDDPVIANGPGGEFANVCESDGEIHAMVLDPEGYWSDYGFVVADGSSEYSQPSVAFDPRTGSTYTGDFFVTYAQKPYGSSEYRDIIVSKASYNGTTGDWDISSPYTISNVLNTSKIVANPSIKLDDQGNILVVWQQKASGSSNWQICGKCVETDLSTVVQAEFSCAGGVSSSVVQTKPDIEWIGTSSSISSFMVAYVQSMGGSSENGIFMRRIQPEGTTQVSSASRIQVNESLYYGFEPALARTGNYYVCSYAYVNNTGSPSQPYKVVSKQFNSQLGTTLPSGWDSSINVNETGTYTYVRPQVDVAGRPGNGFDISYIADVSGNRCVYVGEGTVYGSSVSVENWSCETDTTFNNVALAIAPDFTVSNPTSTDINRRLVVWQTDNDPNNQGIWGRFDPEHCPGAVPPALKSIPNRDSEDSEANIPSQFTLHKAFPNPFNPSTTIKFENTCNSHINIAVYDVQGRLIHTLIDGVRYAGQHSVVFNASDLSSGMYFIQMKANGFAKTEKIILMK